MSVASAGSSVFHVVADQDAALRRLGSVLPRTNFNADALLAAQLARRGSMYVLANAHAAVLVSCAARTPAALLVSAKDTEALEHALETFVTWNAEHERLYVCGGSDERVDAWARAHGFSKARRRADDALALHSPRALFERALAPTLTSAMSEAPDDDNAGAGGDQEHDEYELGDQYCVLL